MEILEDLKIKLNVDDNEFGEIIKEIEKINRILLEEDILLSGQSKIGLYSHMISFFRRVKSGERVMKIGEEVMEELSPTSIKVSEKMLIPIFHQYNVPIDRSEIVLVAIHIEAAIFNDGRRDEDGK